MLQARKKAPNGERLRRVFLILEGLGGPDARFRYRDLSRAYGERWAEETLRRWVANGAILRLRRGLYRLAPEIAEAAFWWLQDEEAEELRARRAEEEAERFRRDEEALEAAAEEARLRSPWQAVSARLEEEKRLRRTEAGRCVLILRAEGRALRLAELEAKLGKRPADITLWRAVKEGLLVRIRPGLYDLPSRSSPPIAENANEHALLVLAAMGAASVAEIAEAAGADRRRTKEGPVKRLRAEGLVERRGPGDYRLTAEGWKAAEAVLRRSAQR